MRRYRIYTEDVNRGYIEMLLNACFSGYTVFESVGMWGGKKDKSLVYEIVESAGGLKTVYDIAEAVRVRNNQEAVLVTHENIQGVLI